MIKQRDAIVQRRLSQRLVLWLAPRKRALSALVCCWFIQATPSLFSRTASAMRGPACSPPSKISRKGDPKHR
jgi:hypothetical protein